MFYYLNIQLGSVALLGDAVYFSEVENDPLAGHGQPPLQHRYSWEPVGTGHGSSPGAGKSKDWAGGSGPRVLQLPEG